MKFSLSIVASLASVVAAGNLRATNDKETVKVQSRVTMTGLLHLPTADELTVLDKIVKETYNAAYKQGEIAMLETKSTGSLLLASEEDKANDLTMILSEIYVQGGGGYCNFCK